MKREHKDEMKQRGRNIALLVAYDGTNYHGFQRQNNAVAVQNVLEEKLAMLFGETIELAAAGRTDTGVHAFGQVVNFFTSGKIPTDRIAYAANSLLPDDITVKEAWEADANFSARHSAKAKTYLYKIQRGKFRDPFLRNYAWHVKENLNLELMRDGLKLLEGVHDFSSFRAAGGAPMSPVREIYEANLTEACDIVKISFYGNGFLYHMVRNMVGTLVTLGAGRMSLTRFNEIFEAKDRTKASPTAPACGLYLVKVEYNGVKFS